MNDTSIKTYLLQLRFGLLPTAADNTVIPSLQLKLQGNWRQQTSTPGAQFSGATWRVTMNYSLRRKLQACICILHYMKT